MSRSSPLALPETPLLRKTRRIAHEAKALGGRALLVGGFVRDALLGKTPKDADIEVYGLEAPALRAMLEKLGRVDCVGESFRVFKLVWKWEGERFELDVSLPRRDRKVGEGHKGFEVEGDPYASVEEAARRRDFTVNAIMCDPLTGEVIDPYKGRDDLESGLLRAVDARHFGEDSLRVLRAMQFAGRFGLQIEPGTVQICRATPLNDLPSERIWGEWEKWLLKSPRPSLGLNAGAETGVFERLFPYLQNAIERRGAEMETALDGAACECQGLETPRAIALMLATLGAEMEVESEQDGQASEELDGPHAVALMLATLGTFLGWRDTRKMLDTLHLFKMRGDNGFVDVRTLTIQLVGARKTPSDWFRRRDSITARDFRFFAARLDGKVVVRLAKARGYEKAAQWFEQGLKAAGVWDGPPAQLLMGRHLLEMGFAPGPHLGTILQRVYLQQLAGEVTTLEAAKELAIQLKDNG